MYDDLDELNGVIEQRLRSDAAKFVPPRSLSDVTAQIVQEHARRCRRRRLAATLVAGAAAVVGLLGWLIADRQMDWLQQGSVAESVAPEPRAVRVLDPQLAGSWMQRSDAVSAHATQRDGADGLEPSSPLAIPASSAAAFAEPVSAVLVTQDEAGQMLCVPMIYVPSHVQQVSLSELSPAERWATQRVLGLGPNAPAAEGRPF